jgi:hypothetical protein
MTPPPSLSHDDAVLAKKLIDPDTGHARLIDDLELALRSANALRAENINFVIELIQLPNLEPIPNLGPKAFNEVGNALRTNGLDFGIQIPEALHCILREPERDWRHLVDQHDISAPRNIDDPVERLEWIAQVKQLIEENPLFAGLVYIALLASTEGLNIEKGNPRDDQESIRDAFLRAVLYREGPGTEGLCSAIHKAEEMLPFIHLLEDDAPAAGG